jgi:hypothetical protein
MQIKPVCVHYGATVVQSLVDQIDPTVLNIGTLKVILTGTADEKIVQTNSILEFEDTLLRGTSVSMAAKLPMVHYQAVPFHQKLFSIGINPDEQDEPDNTPDPDNFRNPDGTFPDLTKYEMQALLAADLSENYKLTVDTLIQLQNGESRLRQLKEDLVNGLKHPYFILKDGLLCKQYSLKNNTVQYLGVYLPTSILYSVLIYIHKFYLHPSKTQTYKEFAALYYHPFASRAAQKVCDLCITCAKSRNAENKNIPVGRERSLKPSKPRELVSMDILYFPKSAKGYQYGLIISDLYSLYISFYPLKMKRKCRSREESKRILRCTGTATVHLQ